MINRYGSGSRKRFARGYHSSAFAARRYLRPQGEKENYFIGSKIET